MIGTSARPDVEAPPLLARPVFLLLGTGVTILVLLSVALVGIAARRLGHAARACRSGCPAAPPIWSSTARSGSRWPAGARTWSTSPSSRRRPARTASPATSAARGPGDRPPRAAGRTARSSRCVPPTAPSTLTPPTDWWCAARRSPRRCPRPAGPWSEREVRFSTVRSPVARAQAGGPVKLKWGQPLQIQWDAPIPDVQYTVTPPTAIRTAIDPNNRQLSTVVLENPEDGQTYKIAVAEARGANGIPLEPRRRVHRDRAGPPEAAGGGRGAADHRAGDATDLRFSAPMDRSQGAKDEAAPKVGAKARWIGETRRWST